MFCKNCGNALNETDAVCSACGVKVGEGNAYCANCGNIATPDADTCLSCGASLKPPYLNGKDKIIVILLALFLGGIGVHNFYMGETKKGIVKIVASFCCLLGSLLALIDIIMILCGKYNYDPEKLFF